MFAELDAGKDIIKRSPSAWNVSKMHKFAKEEEEAATTEGITPLKIDSFEEESEIEEYLPKSGII